MSVVLFGLPEIVRCKDCAYYIEGRCYVSEKTSKGDYPRVNVHSRDPEDFCSYGDKDVLKIVIDEIPPTNNKYMGNSRNFNEYRHEKERWHWMIKAALCGVQKPSTPWEKVVVMVTYYFKDNRRRDIYDNYAPKFLLDPLVREGIIYDDCWQCCKVELDADVDNNNPRTEIQIRRVK